MCQNREGAFERVWYIQYRDFAFSIQASMSGLRCPSQVLLDGHPIRGSPLTPRVIGESLDRPAHRTAIGGLFLVAFDGSYKTYEAY